MVIFACCFVSEDNKVYSFFIMNLAVADFLMGLYLLIIGLHDVMFRGEYIFKDLDWRSGWVCKMCGLLSLLSSEMSVLTLTVITSDRFISIVHPFKFRQRHLAHAVILMVGFWLAAMLIAILPVLHRSYFGEFFYGGNGVCLPLQFDRPFDHGWEFTLVVFVLFNLFAFLFILCAYAQMFATVRKSSLAMRSTKESQDWNLSKRFSIIVATDFICWMPIILVKIASYSGIAIPQSVHAWFAIFVLPVNSALNPILYTGTTQFFRQRFLRPIRRLCGRWKQGKTYQSGSYDDSITGTKISATKLSVISHNGKPRAGSVNGRLNSTKLAPSALFICVFCIFVHGVLPALGVIENLQNCTNFYLLVGIACSPSTKRGTAVAHSRLVGPSFPPQTVFGTGGRYELPRRTRGRGST